MATMVGTHGDIRSVLHDLVELDLDAVEAYRTAIDKLEDTESKSALTGFMGDHERHVTEVGEALRKLGGEPPSGPDFKRVLTQGKVVLGGIAGDKGILKAMKSNEDDTNAAYERASSRTDVTPDLQALLRRNLDDERRHRAWIESRLSFIAQSDKPPTVEKHV